MVSKITIQNKNLSESVEDVLKPLGRMEKFIKTGDRVFLKPNFNTSDPFPASLDLDFIRAVIKIIEKENPKEIILGESSTFFGNAKKFFEDIDPWQLENEFTNLKVLFLNEEKWVKKAIPNAEYMKQVSIPEIIGQVDKIIFLPCLKTHSWAQYTGAIKLSVGLIKPPERIKMHAGHLQEKIAEISSLFKPDLVIMDGRKCFITSGPSEGIVRNPDIILASESRIAIDIEGIKIIQGFTGNDLEGIIPEELVQIVYAKKMGVK